MPCRDYYDDHPDQYFKDVTEPALKKQVSFAESALCQTLWALENMRTTLSTVTAVMGSALDYIDYAAAGITRKELEVWWKNHKKLDAKHREEERLKNVKKAALAKLTAEEREALGIR